MIRIKARAVGQIRMIWWTPSFTSSVASHVMKNQRLFWSELVLDGQELGVTGLMLSRLPPLQQGQR